MESLNNVMATIFVGLTAISIIAAAIFIIAKLWWFLLGCVVFLLSCLVLYGIGTMILVLFGHI